MRRLMTISLLAIFIGTATSIQGCSDGATAELTRENQELSDSIVILKHQVDSLTQLSNFNYDCAAIEALIADKNYLIARNAIYDLDKYVANEEQQKRLNRLILKSADCLANRLDGRERRPATDDETCSIELASTK